MNPTIEVFGNYGTITVDAVTGLVLKYDKDEQECETIAKYPGHDNTGYGNIVRFDLEEWKRFYPDEELCGGDIMDWGFWKQDGTYYAAEDSWRQDFLADRDDAPVAIPHIVACVS